MFGTFPYTMEIANCAPKGWARYKLNWQKNRQTDHGHAGARPMPKDEDILVFSEGVAHLGSRRQMPYYPRLDENGRFPTTVLIYPVEETGWHLHQKPVPLLKRLIELYTLPGDIVCDPCMGSGAVGVAALQLRRSLIGIEKHQPFSSRRALHYMPRGRSYLRRAAKRL